MKKWMKYLLTSSLLLTVLSPLTVSAKDSGEVRFETAENSYDVGVTMILPEGVTETITSLRFQMYVEQISGEMKEPEFTFSDSITSLLKDAEITEIESGNGYLIDVVLSGRADEEIFDETGTAEIGTITVKPVRSTCYAEIGLVPENNEADKLPAVQYVDAGGIQTMTSHITTFSSVNAGTYTNVAEPGTDVGDSGEGEIGDEESGGTDLTGTDVPNESGSVPGTGIEEPGIPKPPTAPEKGKAVGRSVLKSGKTELGTRNITLTWTKVNGANGYQIYKKNSKTKAFELFKKVSGGSTTSYKALYAFGESFTFKVKAYQTGKDGSMLLGDYSNELTVTVPEYSKFEKTSVTSVNAATGSTKVTLKWKMITGADGYRIEYKTGKKAWKLLGTSTKTTYTTKALANGTVYKFRVRPYALKEDGKTRVPGKHYSTAVSFKTPPAQVKNVAAVSKAKRKAVISWKKTPNADGYRIYRKTSKNGQWKAIATLKKGTVLSYTDKTVKSGKTYYYKVRAYSLNGKKQSFGTVSAARSVKAK